jgi:hypothetical protein
MRLAVPLATLVLLAALLPGCGGSGETTASPHSIDGGSSALEVRSAWERDPDCQRPRGASRWGCSIGPFRCQGVVTGHGLSISCAKPGRSVAFIVRRG